MAQKRTTYEQRANELAQAIDIAVSVLQESLDLPEAERTAFINFSLECRNFALRPEPAFKKVASLNYIKDDVLTYWNEAPGAHVQEFWARIQQANLPFKQKNVLQDVLRRGKIKNRSEYHVVVDQLVVGQQTGQITAEQAQQLSLYLGEFESKSR